MLHATSRVFDCNELALEEVASRFWARLQERDDRLPNLEQVGAGEIVGGRLRVRFVHDHVRGLFAAEVADMHRGDWWEVGFARLAPRGWRTFWRDLSGSPDAPSEWRNAVESVQLAPSETPLEPTFLNMASAYAATGGVVLTENLLARAALAEDLAYWSELARTQDDLIRRAATRFAGYTHDVVPPSQQPLESHCEYGNRSWTLDSVHEWAAAHSKTIVILPRATSAARKAAYEDHGTLFAALEILAHSYRAVKMGSAPRDQARHEFEALGITMGGSVAPAKAGGGGNDYFVRWRGRRRFLDQHLKRGASRDPRFCLRIYFTWDDELQLCVVGWLPSHLPCSID
jgi:hypothetical protein